MAQILINFRMCAQGHRPICQDTGIVVVFMKMGMNVVVGDTVDVQVAAKAITGARVVAFPELGMEAIYEFEVRDMPVTVAVDINGESVHQTGPAIWKAKIEEQAIEVA